VRRFAAEAGPTVEAKVIALEAPARGWQEMGHLPQKPHAAGIKHVLPN
jgi:hypothetical protein